MTLPWSKLPRYLAGDPRLTLLSPEAACAYLAARLLADDYGSLWCVGNRDAVGTLAAVIARQRPGDPAWARRAVYECVAAGLLDLCDEGAAMRVVDWLADGAPQAAGPAAPAERPGDAKRAPGRPRKGAAPMTARERRVRSAFTHREWAEFRGVPESVTWEQWAAEHPATRARLLRTPNETRERNPSAANETPDGANETHERNPLGSRAVSETSEASGTQRDGETRGKSESPDARGGERNPRTKPANETRAANETPRATLGTVEEVAPLDVDVLLREMGTASAGRIAAASTTPHMREFGAVARDLIAHGHATPAALVKAAGHAAHVPWIRAQRHPLTVERLYAAGGKILVELLTGATACADCGGAPLASPAADGGDDSGDPAWLVAKQAEYRRTHPLPAPEGAP